jgi:hypothetical protein
MDPRDDGFKPTFRFLERCIAVIDLLFVRPVRWLRSLFNHDEGPK